MIYSKARELLQDKQRKEARRISYDTMIAETGLSRSTLARVLAPEPIERIEGNTMSKLCEYFGVGPGELLLYVPDSSGEGEQVIPQ